MGNMNDKIIDSDENETIINSRGALIKNSCPDCPKYKINDWDNDRTIRRKRHGLLNCNDYLCRYERKLYPFNTKEE